MRVIYGLVVLSDCRLHRQGPRSLSGIKVFRMKALSNAQIEIPEDLIASFCRRNKIRRLAIFGSVLRDDFTPESDVDVLVEFEPDALVGLAFITIQDELSETLERQVDLQTFSGIEKSRNWLLRAEILGSAEEVYEQTR